MYECLCLSMISFNQRRPSYLKELFNKCLLLLKACSSQETATKLLCRCWDKTTVIHCFTKTPTRNYCFNNSIKNSHFWRIYSAITRLFTYNWRGIEIPSIRCSLLLITKNKLDYQEVLECVLRCCLCISLLVSPVHRVYNTNVTEKRILQNSSLAGVKNSLWGTYRELRVTFPIPHTSEFSLKGEPHSLHQSILNSVNSDHHHQSAITLPLSINATPRLTQLVAVSATVPFHRPWPPICHRGRPMRCVWDFRNSWADNAVARGGVCSRHFRLARAHINFAIVSINEFIHNR